MVAWTATLIRTSLSRKPIYKKSTAQSQLLCRMYLGWPRETKAINYGINELASKYPIRGSDRSHYYWYYATQVMHHAGGKEWEAWNQAMKPQLLASQVSAGNEAGDWDPAEALFDRVGGRAGRSASLLARK